MPFGGEHHPLDWYILRLHRFSVAPCVTQTPPFYDNVGTSFVATLLSYLLRTMRNTNASPLNIISTSLKAALFPHPVCTVRDTNSSLNDIVVTPVVAASFHLCSMCDTHYPLDNLVETSLVAAPFPPRYVCYVCLVNRLGFLLCTQRMEGGGDKFLTMTAPSTINGRRRDEDEWDND